MKLRSNLETTPVDTNISHELTNNVQDPESITLAAILKKNASEREIQDDASNNDKNSSFEDNQGSETTKIPDNMASEGHVQETVTPSKESISSEAKIETEVSTTQLVDTTQKSTEEENLTKPNTETKLETPAENDTLSKQTSSDETEITNTPEPSTYMPSTSRQDSAESTDVYKTSSELNQSDSHENEGARSPDVSKEKTCLEPPSKVDHVPLHVDTWSGRSLPTTQTIEHLAISQKYIFCVDVRNQVYFSDPNTASCSGWEKADFKAKQIFVSSACDFISYLEKGKAYVRGNINDINPVGSVSFHILDEVSVFSSCSSCTWAITAGNTF